MFSVYRTVPCPTRSLSLVTHGDRGRTECLRHGRSGTVIRREVDRVGLRDETRTFVIGDDKMTRRDGCHGPFVKWDLQSLLQ